MTSEIEDANPPNVIHFVVDFLCKNYPEHLHGFASIWNADPDLERERQEVCRFFKQHKISTQIAAHFTNAGYDTLETLATLHTENLADIEAFNNVKWLPGHKVRLQHVFADIDQYVRAHRAGIPGGAVMYGGNAYGAAALPLGTPSPLGAPANARVAAPLGAPPGPLPQLVPSQVPAGGFNPSALGSGYPGMMPGGYGGGLGAGGLGPPRSGSHSLKF